MTVGAFWHSAFAPTVFYCDPVAVDIIDTTDGYLPKKGKRRKTQREITEELLNKALDNVFDPPSPEPAPQPVPEPVVDKPVKPLFDVPEFNPEIVGLGNYVEQLQAQLAQHKAAVVQRQLELAQMEAEDDDLLLLSL